VNENVIYWFAVNTHARSEEKARFNLERQGFQVYLPRYLKKRSHARRTDTVPAPLFPRYLFVAMDVATARWRSINSTFGVSHLVTNGNEPLPVDEQVIEEIRAREDEQGWVKIGQFFRYRKGEKIQVVNGPLAGLAGLFDCFDGNERVFVLLNLMGQMVKMRTEAENVGFAD